MASTSKKKIYTRLKTDMKNAYYTENVEGNHEHFRTMASAYLSGPGEYKGLPFLTICENLEGKGVIGVDKLSIMKELVQTTPVGQTQLLEMIEKAERNIQDLSGPANRLLTKMDTEPRKRKDSITEYYSLDPIIDSQRRRLDAIIDYWQVQNLRASCVPDQPRNLQIDHRGQTSLAMSWEPPIDVGILPTSSYIVEKRTSWTEVARVNGDTHSCVAGKLTEGTDYEFRITPVNEFGKSLPLTHTANWPDGNIQVDRRDKTSFNISWRPLNYEYGPPIKCYIIEKRSKWVKVAEVAANKLECVVDKLVEGTGYDFRITAVNAFGKGVPLKSTETYTAHGPYGVPSRPRNMQIDRHDLNSLAISWKPPFYDGGSPVTSYIVEKRTKWVEVAEVPADVFTYIADKLIEGTDYEFRITAVNNFGKSLPLTSELTYTAQSPFVRQRTSEEQTNQKRRKRKH